MSKVTAGFGKHAEGIATAVPNTKVENKPAHASNNVHKAKPVTFLAKAVFLSMEAIWAAAGRWGDSQDDKTLQ